MRGHSGLVYSVALRDDGLLAASGGYEGTIKLWATASGQLLKTLEGHTSGIRGVALSGDGRLVASGSEDQTIRLWETDSGRPLATLAGHTGGIWDVALNGGGRLAASASDDQTVRIWAARSGRLQHTLRGDRRYERINIAGLTGVNAAQHSAMLALGAVGARSGGRHTGNGAIMTTSWRNWSGGIEAAPARIVSPASEADLVALLAADRAPVRVVGAGHSFTPLCATAGTLISLEALSGIVSTDASAPGGPTATVWAGTRLHDLGEPLYAAGFGLANMGDIDRQALAGAVSTGTHGTGRTLGSISTQVVGLRLVLADGSVLDCSETVEPEVFRAARVSMGALGVLAQITLRVLPAYRLHQRTWPEPFDACLEHLDDLIAENRHFECFWSPADDACAMKTLNPTDRPCGEIAPVMEAPGRLPRYLTPELVDWSHRVFPSERTVLFNEMEFAVPAEAGPACLREIRRLMQTHHPGVYWPIEYRTVRADDLPLSPATGRATVTISIHQAADLPHQAFFADAEAIFRAHQGRPHWGKLHTHTAPQLRALYPAFDRFRAVRERLDPGGRFLNSHLRTLLLDGI